MNLSLQVNRFPMATLSAVIITYNEEANIERCITSLSGVVDEIVVVDSLSADRTKEICLRHSVRFFEQPFLGYIEQKNFALSKAATPYVLCVDADEALSGELKQQILFEKEAGFPFEAYSMKRLNFYCGTWLRHGAFYPDIKLRLFKKDKGRWGGTNPHDKVFVDAATKVKHINADLLHYTYQAYEAHRRQTDRFSTIAAEALYKSGSSATYLNIILSPAWRFIKEYIIHLGFLDGKNGFMVAYFSARLAFLKYRKFFGLKRTKPE